VEQVAGVFRALGDPVRLGLAALIVERGEVGAGELAEATPVSRPTVSHHLRVLLDAGLVSRERRGKQVVYSPVDQAWDQLRAVLDRRPAG